MKAVFLSPQQRYCSMLQSCPDPGVMLHVLFNRVTRSFTQKISLPNSVLQAVRSCFDRWTYTDRLADFLILRPMYGPLSFQQVVKSILTALYTYIQPFLNNQNKDTLKH